MRQLTIDGRQEDIPERHERMKLFEAPKTMKGQLPMTVEQSGESFQARVTHDCGHTYASASRWNTEQAASRHAEDLLRCACSVCRG